MVFLMDNIVCGRPWMEIISCSNKSEPYIAEYGICVHFGGADVDVSSNELELCCNPKWTTREIPLKIRWNLGLELFPISRKVIINGEKRGEDDTTTKVENFFFPYQRNHRGRFHLKGNLLKNEGPQNWVLIIALAVKTFYLYNLTGPKMSHVIAMIFFDSGNYLSDRHGRSHAWFG